MAELVQIIGIGHSPTLPRRFLNPNEDSGILKIKEKYGEMGRKLKEARPDLLLVIGHDHVSQWFMDNMPAFLVGKAPVAEGPFMYEEIGMGVPHYKTPIDVAAAKSIIQGGFHHGVDFAYSDEFIIDHAFTVPLTYIRPEADLPIVPIFTNVMAPPVAPSARFYQVGVALRAIIEEELPRDMRVAAIFSGHLSVELGGPELMNQAVDREFDECILRLIGQGDVDGLLRETSYERMIQAGNFTSGVLDYVMAVGLAQGERASQAEGVFASINTQAFLVWDLDTEKAE